MDILRRRGLRVRQLVRKVHTAVQRVQHQVVRRVLVVARLVVQGRITMRQRTQRVHRHVLA